MKTKFNDTNAQIAVIRALHRLSNSDIAKISGIRSDSVSRWFLDPRSKFYRKAPYEVAHKLGKIYSTDFNKI